MTVEKRERKRMLILTSSFPRWPGDFAGCFVAEFAQSLSRDYQITILTPASINAPAIEKRDDLTIYRCNYFWPRRYQLLDAAVDLQPLLEQSLWARLQVPFLLLAFFMRAFWLARNAEIVCSHWLVPAGFIGAIIARLLDRPHVVVEHSGALHLLRKLRFGPSIARFITQGSNKIVTVTDYLRDYLIELSPTSASKIDVVPMGIDRELFINRNQENNLTSRIHLLFLGRLTKVKGVITLIDAVADGIDCRLTIAGDGADRTELEQYARSRGVAAHFPGVVEGADKIALLQNCDIVVIPSIQLTDGRSEGLPVVCLEAFAAGRTVIAAAVGGLPTLIEHNLTGLLFPPGDSQQLRAAIQQLIDNPQLRNDMGARAASLVAQYDWSRIAARFRAIINASFMSEVYDKSRFDRISLEE